MKQTITMKPVEKTETKSMKIEKLKSELSRVKLNEQRLMDQNTEQKKRLAKLVAADIALKKEQNEVTTLTKVIARKDRHVEKLRQELNNVKTELLDEKTDRADEKDNSEKIIARLTKESQEYLNNFSVEKMFREQKEKEIEKLINTETDKKELISHEAGKLMSFKDRFKKLEQQFERQQNELIRYKKQKDIYKKENHLLSKEIALLTSKIEELTNSCTDLEYEMDIVQQENKSLVVDFENQKKEAEKQRKLIESLENELNSCSGLKMKLQKKKRELTKHTMARDIEIMTVRNLITESESQQRRLTIQIESIRTEKKLITENFFKAQTEMNRMNDTIRKLRQKLKGNCREADLKTTELVKVKMNLDSLRCQLENVREQLAETKTAQTLSMASADKAHQLAEKEYAKIAAEKEKLELEVQQYHEQAVQQTRMLNLQDAEKAKLEETIREYAETVKSLRPQIKRLQLEHNFEDTMQQRHAASSRRERTRCKTRNRNTIVKMLFNQQRQYVLSMKNIGGKNLEQKKEIEDLKCKLTRRPDDAIKKYQECQWHNGHLKKEVMASRAVLTAYEAKHKELEEENKRLTDDLRKLKLEDKHFHLPPIRKLPPSEDKSNKTYVSGHIAKHTLTHDRFPLHSKSQMKYTPLPPISSSLRCNGRKITPHRHLNDPSP
ncbi:tax1-binding protein 1 homolog [Etheostoma spectabile]|uniref:tax1-binding protein 1 homolog n=1 Tax=Etheostoma spectabile TaxID=54343 RepID=UPI0013AEB6E5|nr:tax1-binding protein 1 homolog [Etheostoma spectabile]